MRRRSTVLLISVAILAWGSPSAADPTDSSHHEPSEPTLAATTNGEAGPTPRAASPLPEGFLPGSSYGWRISPRTGRRTFHAGLDFLAPRGTDVRAAADGIVERITEDRVGRTRFGGYGRAVVVRHPELGVWTFYAHLDSVDVTEGQTLAAGERLGAVGNSTNHRYPTMTPHLHFEVRHGREHPRGAQGLSPFPGTYRGFNLDPEAWLAEIGVHYDSHADDPDHVDLPDPHDLPDPRRQHG
ncbi:MAG: M23 family metallopeptidase [Sandaracinaceae bacterium]